MEPIGSTCGVMFHLKKRQAQRLDEVGTRLRAGSHYSDEPEIREHIKC